MFFSLFFIFVITLVADMIVPSSFSLFLVFHMWFSIVVVSVRVSLFVFGGSDNDETVRVSCWCILFLCESLITFFETLPNFFVPLTVNVTMSYILCFVT